MEIHNALRQECRIRFNVRGRKSLIVRFPYEVVEREARKRSITVAEFLEQFRAVAQYDSFDGVHYIFELIPQKASSKEK